MNTYEATRNRLLQLLEEKRMSIHKLATESAVAPSSIKNILYGKSKNPGVVTLKMLCDGFGISLYEFFDTDVFRNLEQEIK
ncbi:MAG: helix-turn-helix transcriptional regulator [Clostridia bacterium]|jgi:transcriptional regulator with XRE-family HTH domain|nr:helix-turn-helix transcriptional regulator [Clostridia bacterium]